MRLSSVADQNQQVVATAQEKQLAALHAQGMPPLPLRTRDQAVVREPATPPTPDPEIPVRIVAEDNAPPERPAVMASNNQPRTQQRPATRANQSSGPAPAPVQTQPPQPVPTIQPKPEDETPLLPVIPDETPSR